MQSEREKLIKELYAHGFRYSEYIASDIADFILADRKRIVQPLVDVKQGCLYNFGRSGWIGHDNLLTKAIDNTITLAGITEGKT